MTEQMIPSHRGEASSFSLSAELANATGIIESETHQQYQPNERVTAAGMVDRMVIFARKRFSFFKRLVSFLIVGGLGALVNIAFFTFTYTRLERSTPNLAAYLVAFALATEISLLFNFMLNDQITFRQLRGQKRSWQIRCVRFHVTSIGGTLLTLAFSFSLLNIAHTPALFAQALALIVATAFNFAFHHFFTYQHI